MSEHRHARPQASGPVGATALTMGAGQRLAIAVAALVPLWLVVWWCLS